MIILGKEDMVNKIKHKYKTKKLLRTEIRDSITTKKLSRFQLISILKHIEAIDWQRLKR